MLRKLLRLTIRMILGAFILVSLPFIWRLFIVSSYGRYIQEPDTVPAQRVAIVFGAGIHGNGQPSDALRDRLDVAIDLYQSGKVERLLLSGDNSFENYNEPGVMINYVRNKNIPFEHIQPDYGGRRTYDSCYRAKHIDLSHPRISHVQSINAVPLDGN